MPKVRICVTKTVSHGQPDVVMFELLDAAGVRHTFCEKLPYVLPEESDSAFPSMGGLRCTVVQESEHTFFIDTSVPDDVESVGGKHLFEVKKSDLLL